jgi:hypothetical protein
MKQWNCAIKELLSAIVNLSKNGCAFSIHIPLINENFGNWSPLILRLHVLQTFKKFQEIYILPLLKNRPSNFG